MISGIYRYLRHPQYLGLARREDRELAARFGEAFRAYAALTPAFLPSRPEGTTEAADARHPR